MNDKLVDTVKLYEDAKGEWRWSAQAGNGDKLADSGEGYKNHGDALDSARALFPDAQLVDPRDGE